ncbi:hypothetical protein LFM09_00360 [Lentzea alba]|uniref:hypothetical protein n=1 Tax=Lentzea alba TaxID=2714351 RepID=UPI0039BF6F2D
MKRTGVFVVLLAASLITAPQASAADCTWTAQDLPVPAGAQYAEAHGSSPNNTLITGSASFNKPRGVVWENGVLRQMAEPAQPETYVNPRAVNNSGTVVGSQLVYTDGKFLNRAFRYENGRYEMLATEQNEETRAIGVNEAGDVIGEVSLVSSPGTPWVAMWPKGQPRRLYSKGFAVGIGNERQVVLRTPDTAWVIDGNNGRWTQITGGRYPIVLDNERVLHYAYDGNGSSRVWDWALDGRSSVGYVGAETPFGKNSGGALFASLTGGGAAVWRDGGRTGVVADKMPQSTSYGDITDDGVLIGSYLGADGNDHAARWFCA